MTKQEFKTMTPEERDVTNKLLQAVEITQRMYPTIAQSYRLFVDALMAQGFSRSEAIEIAIKHNPRFG